MAMTVQQFVSAVAKLINGPDNIELTLDQYGAAREAVYDVLKDRLAMSAKAEQKSVELHGKILDALGMPACVGADSLVLHLKNLNGIYLALGHSGFFGKPGEPIALTPLMVDEWLASLKAEEPAKPKPVFLSPTVANKPVTRGDLLRWLKEVYNSGDGRAADVLTRGMVAHALICAIRDDKE